MPERPNFLIIMSVEHGPNSYGPQSGVLTARPVPLLAWDSGESK